MKWGNKIQCTKSKHFIYWMDFPWLVDQYNKRVDDIKKLTKEKKELDKYVPGEMIYMSRRIVKKGELEEQQDDNVFFELDTDREVRLMELCSEINEDDEVSDKRKELNEFAEIYADVTGRDYIIDLHRPDWSARSTNYKISNKKKERRNLEDSIKVFLKNGGTIQKL